MKINQAGHLPLFTAAAVATAALMAPACGGADTSAPAPSAGIPAAPSTVSKSFEGGFDGTNFTVRLLDDDATGGLLPTPGPSGDNIGTVAQEVLLQQDSGVYGPTKSPASGIRQIALQQANPAVLPGASWSTGCGTSPTVGTGVCAAIQMRNLYTTHDLARGYVYLTSLTAGTGVTNLTVTPPGSGVDTATPDAALLGVSPVSNALWRYGMVERSTPDGQGPVQHWAFTGTATGTFSFHFIGEVVGALMRPTVRAGLVNGQRDKAPYYQSLGTSSAGLSKTSSLDATSDGRYIVFASSSTTLTALSAGGGTNIYRYDTSTGETKLVSQPDKTFAGTVSLSTCNSINPSISSNGNFVAFESSGASCDLGYGSPGGVSQIYVRNMSALTTSLVTYQVGLAGNGVAGTGTMAAESSTNARIAEGGGYIAFQSLAKGDELVAGRPTVRKNAEIYRYNMSTHLNQGAAQEFKPPNVWPGNTTQQQHPDISSDGKYIVFDSNDNQLVSTKDLAASTIYMSDFTTGSAVASRISTSSAGVLLNATSQCVLPTISEDGSAISYLCQMTGQQLVTTATVTDGAFHVYRRTRLDQTTLEVVDRAADGTESETDPELSATTLSKDGSLVGYLSQASNLLRDTGSGGVCTPGACMSSGSVQAYVLDASAADPLVHRSYLASQISYSPSSGIPYLAAAQVTEADNQRIVRVAGTRDNAFVVYIASNVAFGNSAGNLKSPAGLQLYVSPFSDALFQ